MRAVLLGNRGCVERAGAFGIALQFGGKLEHADWRAFAARAKIGFAYVEADGVRPFGRKRGECRYCVADAASQVSEMRDHQCVAGFDAADGSLEGRARRCVYGMAAVIDQHATHVDQEAGRVDLEQVGVAPVLIAGGIDVHDEGHEARSDNALHGPPAAPQRRYRRPRLGPC